MINFVLSSEKCHLGRQALLLSEIKRRLPASSCTDSPGIYQAGSLNVSFSPRCRADVYVLCADTEFDLTDTIFQSPVGSDPIRLLLPNEEVAQAISMVQDSSHFCERTVGVGSPVLDALSERASQSEQVRSNQKKKIVWVLAERDLAVVGRPSMVENPSYKTSITKLRQKNVVDIYEEAVVTQDMSAYARILLEADFVFSTSSLVRQEAEALGRRAIHPLWLCKRTGAQRAVSATGKNVKKAQPLQSGTAANSYKHLLDLMEASPVSPGSPVLSASAQGAYSPHAQSAEEIAKLLSKLDNSYKGKSGKGPSDNSAINAETAIANHVGAVESLTSREATGFVWSVDPSILPKIKVKLARKRIRTIVPKIPNAEVVEYGAPTRVEFTFPITKSLRPYINNVLDLSFHYDGKELPILSNSLKLYKKLNRRPVKELLTLIDNAEFRVSKKGEVLKVIPPAGTESIHGAVEKLTNRLVTGYAYDDAARRPLKVEVRLENRVLRAFPAARFRAEYADKGQDGKVGFQFRLAKSLRMYINNKSALSFYCNGRKLPILVNEMKLFKKANRRPVTELFSLIDDQGFFVTKKGSVKKSIHLDYDWQERVLDEYTAIRKVFKEVSGMDLYLTAGTLLGYVRDDGFIPGDDDFDTAYLSACSKPEEVKEELLDILRKLKARGIKYRIGNRRNWLKVIFDSGVTIDIFPSWVDEEGFFNQTFAVRGAFGSAAQGGFKEVDFKNHKVIVPVQAEEIVAGFYGQNWRVPDKNFQWIVPKETFQVMRKVKISHADVEELQST